MCSQIWEKQLPAFQEKNPTVEDPDVIGQGTKIIVQACKSSENNDLATNVDDNNLDKTGFQSNKEEVQVQQAKKQEQASDDNLPSPYVHLYGGFITENEKFDQVDPVYGVGVTGDLFKFLGYDLRVIGSAGAIFLQNEVIFKTAPGKVRGTLLFGFGNRIGLQNKDLDRLNKGVDSFTYTGLGVEMNPHSRYRFLADITTNLGTYQGLNFGASAQKRFGDDFWFGVYGEIQSSKSIIDNGAERKFYTGGLKLSF